ncbi:uncharacterized protein LOC116926189 isoform X2 [Daphnia magna]|uniref:uncharacterized protein LOC116926189 isoform X2 n=1 Tax=Daphnia magna TaxID=35525 RepID=UPI001E1BA612|nr:uncharacterized protein LOC116926189 isoform X2 [Daphnia magna]
MMNGELLNGLDHISHECHPMRNHAAAGSSIQQSGLSSTAFTLRGEMAYEANRAYYENQGLISSYVHRDMAYEPHRANYDGNSIQTRNFTSGEASIQPVLSSSYTVNEGLPVHESNGENNSSNPTLPAVQSYEPDPLRVNVQTSNLNGGVGTYGYLEDKINSLSTSLQEVKDLLKKIVLMIQKSLQTPEKFLNKNVKYFEEEVKELIQNMPFDEVEQLVALEKVLMGEKHSRICMVCYLVNHFKTANTQAIFVSQIWRKISTDKLMQVLQWKSGRGDDQRNGISQMIHLVSVIGVSLGLYCQNKKIEEPSIVELKDFIQKARSQGGARFRTANKISHSAAMNNHRAALEEDPDSRAESAVLTSTIKSLVSVLSSDVKAFQFQSAPSATH